MSMDLTPWLMGVGAFQLGSARDGQSVVRARGHRRRLARRSEAMAERRLRLLAASLRADGLLGRADGAASAATNSVRRFYCAINVGLIFLSIFLMRRVYAVFGAIGVTTYLGYLVEQPFSRIRSSSPSRSRASACCSSSSACCSTDTAPRSARRWTTSAGALARPAAGAYAGIPMSVCKALAPSELSMRRASPD